MTEKEMLGVAQYDRPDLYATASSLRQQQDAGWVLASLPVRSVAHCLDVGCGDGRFLQRLISAGRVRELVAGFDRSAKMVMAAQSRLQMGPAKLVCQITEADALDPPDFEYQFELVTMLAVLHWLYPREEEFLPWIDSRLCASGFFCLTTYHPTVEGEACGGTDDVVLAALARIGEPPQFAPSFIPMGTRARPKPNIERLLGRTFHIDSVQDRRAVTQAASASQFTDYFRATFGSYYLQTLPPGREGAFLQAVGEVAMERMRSLGHVTSMDVRLWICRSRRR